MAATRNPERAFAILELLVTVSVLIIVLGLMVSLARHVRATSAAGVTDDLLRQLDIALANYQLRTHGALVIASPPDDDPSDETARRDAAARNTAAAVAALRQGGDLPPTVLIDLPASMYANGTLRDAWGTPIAYFPRFDAQIGMAPDDRPFFVSAGPDRLLLTRDDNRYSYEETREGRITSDER